MSGTVAAPSPRRARPLRSTPRRAEPSEALRALMADLGPQLRPATGSTSARLEGAGPTLPTGLEDFDRLLGGGFPCDRLCEVNGPPSSGRTSLALALLAHTTAAGECAAFVDPSDGFDPASAASAGVVLERVLWARPRRSQREWLRCVERLLETEGLPLVLLDLATSPGVSTNARSRNTRRHAPRSDEAVNALPPATWLRLARLARSTTTSLIVLSQQRLTGSHAQIALEMQPATARFEGEPSLLEGLETQAVVVRHRSAPSGRSVSLRLATRAA